MSYYKATLESRRRAEEACTRTNAMLLELRAAVADTRRAAGERQPSNRKREWPLLVVMRWMTVEVPVPSADIGTPMNAMRTWLDQVRFEPLRFSWQETTDGAVVLVQFKAAEEAVTFAGHFLGRVL